MKPKTQTQEPQKQADEPMKSAQPKTQTRTPDSRSTDPTFDEIIEGLGESLAWFLSRPTALYKWLTAPHGGQRIIIGAITIYLWAISAEAYWLALGYAEQFAKTRQLKLTAQQDRQPFIPKPFSSNSGSLTNAGAAFSDPSFYVMSVISLAILGIQANLQRGKKPIHQAKRDYEAVKNFRVGEVPADAIDIVREKAREYKEAGSHQAKNNAALVRFSYLVDITANAADYLKFMTLGLGPAISSAVWIWLGVWGAEKMVGYWEANEDRIKGRSTSLRFPRLLRQPTDSDKAA